MSAGDVGIKLNEPVITAISHRIAQAIVLIVLASAIPAVAQNSAPDARALRQACQDDDQRLCSGGGAR